MRLLILSDIHANVDAFDAVLSVAERETWDRAAVLGDLVGYARQGGITFDYQPLTYASHTDLVVAVRPREIDVIGGNVKDSVSLKTVATDDQGRIVDKNQRWFVVMAPTP